MTDYRALAYRDAQRYGFPPDVFVAQIEEESGFQPFRPDGSPTTSSAGAIGIAQFMPGTAAGLGIDPTDPVASLDAAARWMAQLVQQFGSVELALAAYNAGPGAVQQYGGVPPFEETERYVVTILANAGQAASTAITTAPVATGPGLGVLLVLLAALWAGGIL